MLQRRVFTLFRWKELQTVPQCFLATESESSIKERGQFKLVEARGWTKVVMGTPSDSSMAHCVSADLQMSGGIMPAFKKMCNGFEELKNQERRVGQIAVSNRNDTSFVYHLVTRSNWWDAATPSSMRSCMEHLREHCQENGVDKLAIPRLGTGEDRLDWPIVKQIIEDVFKDTDISITAYTMR